MKEVVEKPKKDASRFFAENSVKESHVEQSPITNAFKEDLRQDVFQQYNNFYGSKMENRPIWRKWRFLAAGTFAFVVVATSIAAMTLTGNSNTEKKLSAEVAYVEGDFEYLQEGDVWADASQDMTIVEGDSVRISGEGRAIINLDDGSSIRLASNSAVTLASMDPNDIVISNDEGEIYTRVVKAERSFKVETGDVTYESLGTAYKTVNTKDQNGVFVYHSEVAVKDSADDQIVVKEGSKYFVKAKNNKDTKEVIELSEKDIEDEFVQWNKEQDEKEFKDELGVLSKKSQVKEENSEASEEEKVEEEDLETSGEEAQTVTKSNGSTTPAPTPAPQPVSISISSVTSPSTGKFNVQWNASGDTSQGFKVIYNTGGNPSYPNDNPVYIGDGGQRSANVSGLAGGTYYVRVCRYTGSGCDSYSNQVQVTVASAPVISSVSANYSGGQISWTTNTGTTGNGFKVVYNATGTPAPTYPDNSIQYVNSFNFTPSSNGFYRICAWDGGSGCTAYSAMIEVTDK